jgi:hypothetical protein
MGTRLIADATEGGNLTTTSIRINEQPSWRQPEGADFTEGPIHSGPD